VIQTIQKQPSEVVKIVFDFTDVLGSAATIASITSITSTNCGVVSGSVALTLSGQTFAGKKVACFGAAGTAGETYKQTAIAVDSDGQTLELDGYVEVVDP
jgi:hypothetical protein